MELIFLYLILCFGKINLFMINLNQYYPQYCFFKIIKEDNQRIIFNYATIGEQKELINVTFTQITPKKNIIYSKFYLESDEYNSPELKQGKYNLCFIPNTKNEFKISFNFQTLDDKNMNDIGTDTQLKNIVEKVKKIKSGFQNLEDNTNNLLNTKHTHLLYLTKYLVQIKRLTFAKIIIIGLMVLFQIYVIQKMFGEDKRISKIKPGLGKDTDKNDFL